MLGFHSIERGTINRFPEQRRYPIVGPYQYAASVKQVSAKNVQAKTVFSGTRPKAPPPVSRTAPIPKAATCEQLYTDQQNLISIVNKIYDMIQHNQSRLERDVADVRQQHSVLVTRREEESAEVSNVIQELSSLKQRLSRVMSQAEGHLHAMEKASVPAQLQKDLTQLRTECNWLYATVSVPRLNFYGKASTTETPGGYYVQDQRILVLYGCVENPEGLWMQIRHASEPERRYWIRLVDSSGQVTIGKFDVVP